MLDWKHMRPFLRIFFAFFLLYGFACSRAPIQGANEAMRLSSQVPVPDTPFISLDFLEGLKAHVDFLKKTKRFSQLRFGDRVLLKEDYLLSLEYLMSLSGSYDNPQDLWNAIWKDFSFYEVYGQEEWGKVFITSYYEPVIPGSRTKKGEFTQALYSLPKDLLSLDLRDFSLGKKLIQARIVEKNGRKYLKPYHLRKDIDENLVLQKKFLEICWVRPLDAFIMQIQGSGVVEYKDGTRIFLNYAGQNGHSYTAIGRYLQDIIPLEEMNLHRIEEHLKSLSLDEMRNILNQNESYVFFSVSEKRAVTYLGVQASAKHTIATDARFFPKGALAMLTFPEPIFESEESFESTQWQMRTHFVMDQDVGGAIRGPGRVDLFMGSGDSSKRIAGLMKDYGRLYYIAPKEDLLARLKEEEISTSTASDDLVVEKK